jgi:two-component system OmpR family sensor kinase
MLHKSIRWRIQAWHTLLLACLVTGMLGAFYAYERGERLRTIDSQLQGLLTPLLPRIMPHGRPDFDDGPPPDGPEDRGSQTGFAEFENGPFYYAAWSPRHDLISQSATASAVPMPSRVESSQAQFFRNRGDFRELVNFGPDGGAVVVGTPMALAAHELHRLPWTLVGVGLGLTLFGLAGGWWVAGHALRPIGEISAAARQIAAGNRAKRIDIRETDSELGQLAEVLNSTFDQQDTALEQQVRFTADASHELRTPVSVILTQAQLALSREREGHEYRETLKACQRAAERMRALVNSLLELARVDSGEFQLAIGECELATVAAESLELVTPLAFEKNAVLRSSVEPVRIKADSARLGQVLVNLLYNAIQHNGNGVEVSFSAKKQGNAVVLRVADNGSGIPADALPHVFERFYRADKSRTGTKNGSGLGLAISQAIVKAHGGTICVENQASRGAVFTVTLPLAG